MDLFCSSIIPTVGRETLSRAVWSVLDQALTDAALEVIVVNDSGRPLPPADWQRDSRVRVIQTDRRERCIARNQGAAVARGLYLHFLDDDDVLLTGALQALLDLCRSCPGAAWLYGSWQTVDNNGRIVDEFRPALTGNIFADLVAGEGLPLQGSLLRTEEFHAAGGFDPQLCGVEDRDLGRRVALQAEAAYTPWVVARIRIGEVGSTTDWKVLGELDRRGREKALAAPRAFDRLRSAADSTYRCGRVTRAYVASTLLNLERRRLAVALGRAGAAGAFAWWGAARPEFWRGLRKRIR